MKKKTIFRHKYIGKAECPFAMLGAKVLLPKGTPYTIWSYGNPNSGITKKSYWVTVAFYDLGDNGDIKWGLKTRNPHIGWTNKFKCTSTVDANFIKDYILPF